MIYSNHSFGKDFYGVMQEKNWNFVLIREIDPVKNMATMCNCQFWLDTISKKSLKIHTQSKSFATNVCHVLHTNISLYLDPGKTWLPKQIKLGWLSIPKKNAFNTIKVCWCISASIYLSQNTYAIFLLLACNQLAILKDLPIISIYLYLDQNQIAWKEHCIIQILCMECITFKLEDSKNCWHVQKDMFWIFITTAGTLLNIF